MQFVLTTRKDPFMDKVFLKAMKDYNKFFGIKWKNGSSFIFIVKDRKGINLILGKKTEPWVIGWVRGKDVYLLDRKNFEKESVHKYSNSFYAALIRHELVHAFFNAMGLKNTPKWLWEGTATYLSGQIAMKQIPSSLSNFLGYYHKFDSGVYAESGFAIESLITNFGKAKFLKLIAATKLSKRGFYASFKKIYGLELNYENINSLYKRKRS